MPDHIVFLKAEVEDLRRTLASSLEVAERLGASLKAAQQRVVLLENSLTVMEGRFDG